MKKQNINYGYVECVYVYFSAREKLEGMNQQQFYIYELIYYKHTVYELHKGTQFLVFSSLLTGSGNTFDLER